MSICLAGLNHKTAPVDIRESIAFTESTLPVALQDLQDNLNISGALILSTCNRVEILCSNATKRDIIDWLKAFHNVTDNIENHLYHYQDETAVEHAMKVASGIDSLVMGEPQILGQFKRAYQISDDSGLIDSTLRAACQHVFTAAKAVRHETAISHCPVSVAFSAVKLAHQALAEIPENNVLLIGAGETAKLLCKHLQSMDVNNLTIVNRTLAKAEKLATEFDASAQPLSELSRLLPEADIVISATGSEQPIISIDMLENVKRNHNILMIDLAVPRDIEPAIGDLNHVTLHCVDDIKTLIQKNTLQRSHAAIQANTMIEQFVLTYQDKLKTQAASGTICSIRSHAEMLRDEELAKALKQLKMGMDPELVLQQFANALTNKFTHRPSVNLQSASIAGNEEMLAIAQQLFSQID